MAPMHSLCKLHLNYRCKDPRCVRQREKAVRRTALQARGQARLLRKEIQRRFCPGTLGVADGEAAKTLGRHVFTIVGWAQAEKGWEALVLMNNVLSTWGWTTLERCHTLEELARG